MTTEHKRPRLPLGVALAAMGCYALLAAMFIMVLHGPEIREAVCRAVDRSATR